MKDEEKPEFGEGEEASTATGVSAEAVLEMIVNKEDEIRKRLERAEAEAQRIVEEAKLDAAALKRQAVSPGLGQELREKELEKADQEVQRISDETVEKAERIRTQGSENIEQAVKIVIEGVLPPQ